MMKKIAAPPLALRALPALLALAALSASALAAAPAKPLAGAPVKPLAGAPVKPLAGAPEPLPTIAAKTAGLERKAGLLPIYLDRQRGKVWLEVPPPAGERGEVGSYLYVEGLVTGLGSNPVGLDRGQLGDTQVVDLRRVGGRLLIEAQNLRFRALSEDPAERRAVRESFATSVLWAGEVVALDPDGRALVDWTPFLARDAHGVVATLKATGQGSWSLDAERSAVDLSAVRAFPDNLEAEALLTYQSAEPGALVRATVPAAGALTLVEHQSLLKLPDDGYRPRRFDPRAGSFDVGFADYAVALAAPIDRRFIARFRLEKTNPAAPRSPVKKPIVFYVDRGAPEPVRSALIEGASWWAKAFDAAGFEDAFRVELLPEGADPLDARYNVIQWVHRSTRGWSYGGGVIDPRTGEMVKGHVTLGSLRVRQDRLLFEGLAGTDDTGTGKPDDPVVLALARIRQLAAHETGHALGFAHNFAASTYGGRASVMDYPAPQVEVGADGRLDFSHAYAVGMGEWDVQSVRYAYSQLPPGVDEDKALDAIVRDGLAKGLLFLTDQDARPDGAAQPLANLWDNGSDPVAALTQALAVRRIALAGFGEHNVAPGQPLALLDEALAPVYFHHRYQLDAAAKVVGGLDYTYALRGDGQPPARPVEAARQRQALAAITGILAPENLDLPDAVLALLLPRPAGYDHNPEMFASNTSPAFDALGAAATAAEMVVSDLLQPERAARLVDFHRRDASLPGLEEVLEALVQQTFGAAPPASPRAAEIRRVTEWEVLHGMLRLSASHRAPAGVRARVDAELTRIERRLEATAKASGGDPMATYLAAEIARYRDRRFTAGAEDLSSPPPAPPGMPIGMPAPPTLAGCSRDGG